MAWYVIVLICISALFVIQFLMNILGGGDFDSDVSLETSDFFSFKGVLHFVLGFTLTLTVFGNLDVMTIGIATLVGVAFLLGLAVLYRLVYKLKHEIKYQEIVENAQAEVYYWNSKGKTGEVGIVLEGRLTNVPLQNNTDTELKSGDKIIVSGTRKTVKYIQHI